jgi:hypothetical protein
VIQSVLPYSSPAGQIGSLEVEISEGSLNTLARTAEAQVSPPSREVTMPIKNTVNLPVNGILQSKRISLQPQTEAPMLALGLSVMHSTKTPPVPNHHSHIPFVVFRLIHNPQPAPSVDRPKITPHFHLVHYLSSKRQFYLVSPSLARRSSSLAFVPRSPRGQSSSTPHPPGGNPLLPMHWGENLLVLLMTEPTSHAPVHGACSDPARYSRLYNQYSLAVDPRSPRDQSSSTPHPSGGKPLTAHALG